MKSLSIALLVLVTAGCAGEARLESPTKKELARQTNVNNTSTETPSEDTQSNTGIEGPSNPTQTPTPPNTPSVPASPQPQSSGCVDDGNPLDPEKLRTVLSYLASPELAGRFPGTPGDAAARKYVEDRFKCLGLTGAANDGSFFETFTDSEGNSTANVVAYIKGSDPIVGGDIIVIGAHIDHFGTDGNRGLRLGANDNASGVTSVLAVAQAIRQKGVAPRRTTAFMIWGSEELGCEGSHLYVDTNPLTALPVSKVVYNMNFDMVGSYTVNGSEVLAHGTKAGTPALPIMQTQLASFPGFNMSLQVDGLGEDDSDYWAFCNAGIPMVGFFTDDPPCYHQSCDTAEKIDYVNMAKIATVGANTAFELANTTTDLAAFRRTTRVAALGCGE